MKTNLFQMDQVSTRNPYQCQMESEKILRFSLEEASKTWVQKIRRFSDYEGIELRRSTGKTIDTLQRAMKAVAVFNDDTLKKDLKSLEHENARIAIKLKEQVAIFKALYSSNYENNHQEKIEALKSIYDLVEHGYNKASDEKDNVQFKENIFQQVVKFLKLFNKHNLETILGNIRNNKTILQESKLALNCWCISINFIGLFFDHETLNKCEKEKKAAKMISVYLNDLIEFMTINPIARRMIEVALYCLCNYYHRRNDPRERGSINLKLLQQCFNYNTKFPEIKLASAIILSYNLSQAESTKEELANYLKVIYETNIGDTNQEYLGIHQDMIKNAAYYVLSIFESS